MSLAMDQTLQSLLARLPGKRILVVGDLILDEYLWGTVRRISPEAPVPVVEIDKRTSVLGGAANTAANVVGLRAEVSLGGVVGDDPAGKLLVATLSASGVALDGVFVDPGRPTSCKTRVVAHSQQVVRFDHEQIGPLPADVEERLLDWVRRRLPAVDGCVLSDYAKGVVSPALARGLIDRASALGKPVGVDPKGADFARYRGATLVKPNLSEAARFLKLEDASVQDVLDGSRRLLEALGSAAVVVTCGAAGMNLFRPGRPATHIPAEAREVYDVTGAGDTVAGTLAVALAAGADLEQAARLASRAAGVVVGRVGTVAVRFQDLDVPETS